MSPRGWKPFLSSRTSRARQFDNPPSVRATTRRRGLHFLVFASGGVFAEATNVRNVVLLRDGRAARRVVVALVQAEVWFLIRNGRSFEDHRSQGRVQQFRVRPIGSGDHGGERPPLLVHQHAPFRPRFAAIGRVWPHLFPPPKRAWPIAPSAACHFQNTAPSS